MRRFDMNKPYQFSFAVRVALIIVFPIFALSNLGFGQVNKIMPIGDSITKGLGSSDNSGYRNDLQSFLNIYSIDYDFVGSQSDGGFSDNQHEGHLQYTAAQINSNVDGWLDTYNPDYVLLLIGTNDIGANPIENITTDIENILNKIHNHNSSINILLSSLIPSMNISKDNLITELTGKIKSLYEKKKSENYQIRYIGANEIFKSNENWTAEYMAPDSIHPNDTGYSVMGEAFFHGIINLINGGGTITDNFNRQVGDVTNLWSNANSDFDIQLINGQRELNNGTQATDWDHITIFKGATNPSSVAFKYGTGVITDDIKKVGVAVLMSGTSSSTATGYLIRYGTETNDNNLNLWTIRYGGPETDLSKTQSALPNPPGPGDEFKVVIASDYEGHHFDCYVNDTYAGTLQAPKSSIYGNGSNLYAGIISKGGAQNNIDDYDLFLVGDTTRPAKVTDLKVASSTGNTLTLAWTASGDDGTVNRASYYDIRYSTTPISDATWNDATKITNPPVPSAPGLTESYVVLDLTAQTKYYFALKTADEMNNWSSLSNIANGTTSSGGGGLQKVDEFNNPSTLTDLWSANSAYRIQGGVLENYTGSGWGQLAVFKANMNPVEASIQWAASADPAGIDKGGLALMLTSSSYSTANGYLAWIRTLVGSSPTLYLFTLVNGTPTTQIGAKAVPGKSIPAPNDVFKVKVSSDASGHHFDYYLNEVFYDRITDPAKTYSDGTDYYTGIQLYGGLNNKVERFVTINTVGPPKNLIKIKPQGTPTGIVGKALTDSIIVKVTDNSANPISGLLVDFSVTLGGGQLDKIQKDNYVRVEAEDASVLESPMEIETDQTASNGQYVICKGSEPLQGRAEYNFYVKEDGSYVVWCRMFLPDNNSRSLFIQVDDSPPISADPPTSDGVWDFRDYTSAGWEWRVVTDRAHNGDIAVFNLLKGNHKLTVTHRVANGTKLDKILLSNNYNYVPTGLEEIQEYKTDAKGQARAQYTLGTVAGENKVEVVIPGYNLTGAPAIFVINGNADTPINMVASSPTSQTGTGGQKLAQPFEVTLKDKYGNAAANYEITFTVTEGDGFLTNGQTVHKVISDNIGKAATYLTLGTESVNNKVVVSFGSLAPINFTATATSGIAKAMQYQSGNSQSAKVGSTLPNPLKVKIVDNQGNPVVNHNVKFQVTAGGGSLVPTSGSSNTLNGEAMSAEAFILSSGAPSMDVLTNVDGLASVRLVVGYIAGVNTVQATSNTGGSPLTPVEFNATTIPDIPDTLVMVSGNNQTGAAEMKLSQPFVVKVTDQYGNPIYGHKVQYSVQSGDGYLDGKTDRTKTVLTDPEGKAPVYLTLGNVAGVSNQVMAESYIGEELIQNPGFEVAGSGGLDLFANWTIEPHGASTANNETAQVHGDSRACRINVVSGTEYHTTLIQDVSLNVNQEYELSWWGKMSGETQFAYFIKNNDTKHWWKESTQEWVEAYTPNRVTMTSNYEKYAIQFLRESAGSNYQIHFRPIVNSNHTIYLDDVSLTLKTTTALNSITPLGGSPILFKATAGFVTTIQSKGPTTLAGSPALSLNDSLEVYIKDNYGNPVGGYPVKFSSTTGDNPGTFNGYKIHELDVLTDSRGIARVAFYCGPKPGVASSAQAIATGLTGSPINFNVSVAELTKFEYVDGNNQSGSVGSVLPNPLKAKVVDQLGKAIPLYEVTFKVIQGGGKIAGDSVAVIKSDTTTLVAAAKFTLGSAPGTNNNIVEASASYKGKPLPGSPIRYLASATIGEATELVEVSGNYQRTVVGSPLENPLIVLVGDAFRNPYAGRPVTFTVKTGSGYLDGDSTKKTITQNTDNNGKAQVTLTVGKTSGQNNNSVEIISYKPGTETHLTNSPMTFYASATHSAAHTLETVSGTDQPRSPIRQALPQPFVVKVRDRNGNPVSDHPVKWEVVQGGGSFDGLTDSVKTVNTSANGLAQVSYYPGRIAGLQNVVRARSWNQVELNGSPRTFVIDTKEGIVSIKNSVVIATTQVPADGESKSTITVTLQDDWGNKIVNKVVGFLSVTGSYNIQSGFFDPTNSSGQATGYLASKRAELKVIKIRDITDGINLEDTAAVKFNPLSAFSIGYVSGTDQIGNFGTVVKDPIKAIVLDVNGNPIPGHPVQFEAYEGAGYIWEHQGLKSPYLYTDPNGVASANWVMGPSIEVNRARAIAEGLVNSANIRYIATAHDGKAVKIKKESGDIQFGTAGLPLKDPLIVKVVDKNDDPISDYPVTFTVEYGGGNFSSESNPIVRTNPFGHASKVLTLGRIAGSNVVSVKAAGLIDSPIGFTGQGVAGEAAKIVTWSGEQKTGPVGGKISGIQVKVTDIFDNAVSGYTVNFAVNKGDATVNGSGSVVSGPDGIASVNLNLGNAIGEVEIMAAAPGLIGDGLKIKVYAVASSAVSMKEYSGMNQQGTIERELVYPFSVMVFDQYGNPAGGQNVPISFVMIQGNGVVLDRTVYADEKGVASARFQLGNVTGANYKVWAINNSLTGSPVEFLATGVENKFPIIDPIADANIRENQNMTFKVTASDNDNDPIRYGARNLPQGALFDSLGSRQFNWTPSYFQAGKHVIHFMAWDSKGGFDDQPVKITVENVNRLPQVTYYEPFNADLVGHKDKGETFRFTVTATDPDYDELTYEWTDNDILVSTKNVFDFYVADNHPGSHYIKVKVADGHDSVERHWTINVKTPVELAYFSGHASERKGVELDWESTVEVAHAGFNIFRKSASEHDYQQINEQLLKADGTKKYHYGDRSVAVGETYSYKLEDVSISGEKTLHDPIIIFVNRPKDYKLYQNYPNPFNPTTQVEFQLPQQTRMTIKIYNIMGQEVKTLVDEVKGAGYHTLIWNGMDNNGMPVTSGVYYYRMLTGAYSEVKKMVLLR